MNLNLFPRYQELKLGGMCSIAIVGKSGGGKTKLLSHLLQPDTFQNRFGLSISQCSKVSLVYNSYQKIYEDMLAPFTCTVEMLTKIAPEMTEPDYWKNDQDSSPGLFSLCILDDQLPSLRNSRNDLETLDSIINIGFSPSLPHCMKPVCTSMQAAIIKT